MRRLSKVPIRAALAASGRAPRSWVFPTVVLEGPQRAFEKQRGLTKADVASMLLERYGLRCESARTSIHGYPEFLHSLTEVAPWDQPIKDMEDDRQYWPDPLYVVANQLPLDELIRQFQDFCEYTGERRFPENLEPRYARKFLTEPSFVDKVAFARCLGIAGFEQLYRCLFDRYRFWHVNGAPDLIVWDPTPASGFWFLAEVKGPRDSLTKSQLDWIRTRWKAIRGRFLLVIVEPQRAPQRSGSRWPSL